MPGLDFLFTKAVNRIPIYRQLDADDENTTRVNVTQPRKSWYIFLGWAEGVVRRILDARRVSWL